MIKGLGGSSRNICLNTLIELEAYLMIDERAIVNIQ